MRKSRVSGLIMVLLLGVTACSKNTSIETPFFPPDTTASPTTTGKIVRIQQGTDPDLANDSVYKISYTTTGKIKALLDSINQDSLIAGYDASGHLTSITDKNDPTFNAAFTYDVTSGALTQEDYMLAGSHEQYKFAYTNGVVSLKSYLSDLGQGGTPTLQESYAYTVTNGNITDIKTYSATNSPISHITLTYGPQANPFQQLALFNYGGRLGTDNIFNEETFFNKNILTGTTINSSAAATNTNTFNANGYISNINVIDLLQDNDYTWSFSY